MELQLISEDSSLLALCRDIAAEFTGIAWTFRFERDSQTNLDADLRLWDYKPGLCIPEKIAWATKCFVLVRASHVDSFRLAHPYAEASIVLKPVTRAVMRALMAQALASRSQYSSADDSTRSDRDDILQCLMETNLRLQQYDSERTNFIGRALHDFHAPLTALTGYCGLLLEERIGLLNEQQKLVIHRMHHSVRRLSRMSRAMFHLSIGRHIHVRPILREGDLRESLEQALSEVQQLAEEKQLQIDIELEPSAASVSFESSQIEQVMINLLENAYKFSPRSGSVIVKGYPYFWDRRATNIFCLGEANRRISDVRSPNAYRIDIRDSGPGIAPEHLRSIFEEYVSYSGGHDRSGAGLGLAICRMILNQHQGRIWAENGRSGAVFTFVLPFPRPGSSRDLDESFHDDARSELSTACV